MKIILILSALFIGSSNIHLYGMSVDKKKLLSDSAPLMFLGGVHKLYSGEIYQSCMVNQRDGSDVHYPKIVTLFVQHGISLNEVITKWQKDPDLVSHRRAYLKGLQDKVLLFVPVSSLVQVIVNYTLDDEEILKKTAQQEQQICEVQYC